MEKFTALTALAAILDRANVDTDFIIPKQFLKSTERSGFGRHLFNDARFRPDGSENPDFVLNQPRYRGAEILVSRENFGCGSSREHAPWALMDYGFKCVVAPSFADIFKNNSFKNGLLLIELDDALIDALMAAVAKNEGARLTIDLAAQAISGPDNFAAAFAVDPYRKNLLLNGWDDISLTLSREDKIAAYEKAHNQSWRAAIAPAGL